MQLVKKLWTTPESHWFSNRGSLSNSEAAKLSDEKLKEYLSCEEIRREQTLYQTNSEYLMREIAGEVILVPAGESVNQLNGLITFTETGAFLWKLIDEKARTTGDLVCALMMEYGINQEQAAKDISGFIKKALEQGILLSNQ